MFLRRRRKSFQAAALVAVALLLGPLAAGGEGLTAGVDRLGWADLWSRLVSRLGGAVAGVVAVWAPTGAGVDPDGQPTPPPTAQTESEEGAGVDPDGKPTPPPTAQTESETSASIDPNGKP
jgi:hypothetical protein